MDEAVLETSAAFGKKFVEDDETLARKVRAYRELGYCVVLTSGTFDWLHIGHHRYLDQARRRTAELLENPNVVMVVGIDTDESVKRRKGEGRPLVPELERAEMMCAMETVDLVTLAREEIAQWNLMEAVRPDVLIISKRVNVPPERREKYEELCGHVIEMESQATTSTSAKLRLAMVSVAEDLSRRYDHMIKIILPLIEKTQQELQGFAMCFENVKREGGAV